MEYVLPDLCDAYPELISVVEPVFINYGGRTSFGGEIVTIKCFEDNSLVADHVAKNGAGRVLVVDAGGSFRCGMLGDNLALKASQNGWQGIIVYGCIRDVDMIAEIDLGVQALAANPMKSVKKNLGEYNIPVTFCGITFQPGQYIYADNNGIIMSPECLKIP